MSESHDIEQIVRAFDDWDKLDPQEFARAILPLLASAREEERERCARLVDDHQETIREGKEGTERLLSPRYRGNLTGFAYSAAIRARKP